MNPRESGQLTRRRFLKGAGGALAAAGLTGGLAGCARTHAVPGTEGGAKLGGLEEAGIWVFHPSVFEYALGPWQPYMPAAPDQVTLWKSAIDWMADQGLTFAVLHIAPYGGASCPIGADRVRFGWGYHYVLEFEEFPEARTFDANFVKRNQEILRAVTDHAKGKGLSLFFHDYNFMAPKTFIDAHPEVTHVEYLKRGNFQDWKLGFSDMRKVLNQDVCWNKPVYRDFMASCYRELFRRFPGTAGILATPGERARCQCVDCIGEQPDDATAKQMRYRDSEAKRRTIGSFCEVFAKAHHEARKKPLVRTWVAGINEHWVDYLPKGVTYVTKYSVFDLFDGGPDPQIKPWIAAGHDMWFMKETTGGENSGPVVVVAPEAYDGIVQRTKELGVRGLMAVDNAEHGFQFKSRKVMYASNVLFANSVRRGAPPTQQAGEAYFTGIFGADGPAILQAARHYSEVPYQISRVIYEKLEGFTWCFPYHFADFGGKDQGWPGTLGVDLDAPDWAAQGVIPLERYVGFLKDHPWDDTFRKTITGGGEDPIDFMRKATERAESGLKALAQLTPRVRSDARGELDLLINSANLAVLTGKQWANLMEARLYHAGALSPCPVETKRLLAAKCVVKYAEGLEALRAQGKWLEALSADMIDREVTIKNRHQRNVENFEKKDYEALRSELAPLLKQA